MRIIPRSFALSTAALALCAACAHDAPKVEDPKTAPAAVALPTSLKEAVDSNFRSPENRARDQYRHPLETLTFFDVQPEMTVVEITPSGGWYSEILAPYLADKGHYIAAQNAPSDTDEHSKPLKAWIDAHPEVGSKITFTEFKAPDHLTIAPEGSADRVLTFRNVHNWMMGHNQDAVFKAAFKALKPGGMLGVVEHRAAGNDKSKDGKSGYVREKDLMAFAKKAGFKFVKKTEINANPRDTKDYAEGVWTLPPTYRLGATDHAKYEAIGESDRMTMLFMKPNAKAKKSKK